MQAFFLGAGCSRGTFRFSDFPIPVATEFGKALSAVEPRWQRKYPALLQVVRHLKLKSSEWCLESVETCMDYYAKLQPALPRKKWNCESEQMKKALLAVYGRRCDKAADRVRDDSTLALLLRRKAKPGDYLISFNYDTIAEKVATRLGHQLRSVNSITARRPNRGKGDLVFAKPHGSTSWTINLADGSVNWTNDGTPLLQSLHSSDIDSGREPLVLGAVPIKSELIKEVQIAGRTYDVYNAIAAQWRGVVETVFRADTIFILGYSFPNEDQYGKFLIQEGLRRRKLNRGIRIELYELKDKESERAKELSAIFGSHLRELIFRGPVKASGSRTGS